MGDICATINNENYIKKDTHTLMRDTQLVGFIQCRPGLYKQACELVDIRQRNQVDQFELPH